MGRRPKTPPRVELLPGMAEAKYPELLRTTFAELESLAQSQGDPSATQKITRVIGYVNTMSSVFRETINEQMQILELVQAAAIGGFTAGMDYANYPLGGTEMVIWDILLEYGDGLAEKTLCVELAKRGARVPAHLRSHERENWWHARERSHNVAQYISRQRVAFRRWALAEAFYREHVAPARK